MPRARLWARVKLRAVWGGRADIAHPYSAVMFDCGSSLAFWHVSRAHAARAKAAGTLIALHLLVKLIVIRTRVKGATINNKLHFAYHSTGPALLLASPPRCSPLEVAYSHLYIVRL